MSLENLPIDVFLNFLPYLKLPDILSLSIVSKETKVLGSDNQVWRELYIRKKKEEFYDKENSMIRKRVSSPTGFKPDMDIENPVHVSLFIENTSYVTFDIFHVSRAGRYNRFREKKFGKVRPRDTRIIRSYVNHRWLIIPRKDHRTNEVYQSKGFLIKSTDIFVFPVKLVKQDGETKEYENAVHVIVGDPYDTNTAKELVDKSLPKNPRNFKDFKKMVLRSYIPKVKQNLVRSRKMIDASEVVLQKNKNKLEQLQNTVSLQELGIDEEKKRIKKMKRFVKVVQKM